MTEVSVEDRRAQLMAEIAAKRTKVSPVPATVEVASISKWTEKLPLNLPLDQKFELAANVFVEQAINEVATMKSRDAMVAAGIAVEKMQLLRGLPTEIVASASILIRIGEKAAAEGISLRQVLEAVLDNMG